MASSSTSSVPKSFKYDVFLSFRGEDTRTNFTDHLYSALQQKSIYTFRDDERIKKGKRISDELIGSIQHSKFYIIVFSKNYASSSWCLDELVKLIECHKTGDHTAFPVFYDVEPTEVRKQSGAVGEALARHKNDEALVIWKKALKEATDLAGWELKKTANGHEAKFIQKIVEDISLELRSIDFSFDEKLVGMDSRVKSVISYLETGVDDVRMIGIKGMGGSGKTTLARGVFDQISFQFEGNSFVENVREVSNSSLSGLKQLQNQVLSDVLNDQGIVIRSVSEGKKMMKRRMFGRKVLVVLDDVDHIDQLKALAGEPNWFKPGSTIIITTRDEQVLVAHRVTLIRDGSLLSPKEAIRLFSRYAFGRENPIQGYEKLVGQVLRYAVDLPLTIRVLGSFLCGKTKSEWMDALERLKTIPLEETLQKLELSYISLEKDYQKIFLNVACIMKGWSKDLAIEALESCGFHATNGLRVLQQKCLITISHSCNELVVGMHDHIEEMGRNIVRRSHPDKPKKHSRLWIDEEIKDILANDLGTKATRYIRFHIEKVNMEFVMKGLRRMKELRFLHMSQYFTHNITGERKYDNDSQYLPNALQYLHWNNYPLWCLPNTFQGNNLVALKMAHSNITQLWEGGERKVLNKLKILDLSYSKLTTLDLGLIPNLEDLDLSKCYDLEDVHMANKCQKLISLNISHSKLKNLDLGLTPNLRKLDLEGCNNLVQLHVPIGSLENIVHLVLSGCLVFTSFSYTKRSGACSIRHESLEVGPLVELHLIAKSLERCPFHPNNTSPKFQFECFYKDDTTLTRNLETLISIGLCACTNLDTFSKSICGLRCLRKLKIEGIPKVPKELDQLDCLEELSLSGTCMKYLPDSICTLKHLKVLELHSSWRLKKLPEDLGRLECLKMLTLSSPKIKYLPDSICMLKHLMYLELRYCYLIKKLPEDLGRLECLEELNLSHTKIKHLPDTICMLKQLKVLVLRHCSLLEKLPDDLGLVGRLVKLDLSSSKIKHLADTICMLKDLEELILNDCSSLEKLPEDLDRLECLKHLNVVGTCISHLPKKICLLKGLRILGSRWLFQSCGFTSEIQTIQDEYKSYVDV